VTVYLHTAPTSADDWTALLERTSGIAPDLVGFGRSGKGGHLEYSPHGLARYVEALLVELGIDRVCLVGHGWGAAVGVALAAAGQVERPGAAHREDATDRSHATRRPETPDRPRGGVVQVERLVLVDAAPPLDPDGWHRLARAWRRPVVGELVMGSLTPRMLGRALRGAAATPGAWPDERVRELWRQFDQGTQRATLRLHRWADQDHVAELAGVLESLAMPTLVVWGEHDGWFSSELAAAWVRRLPQASLVQVPQAGHWPWLSHPEVVERIAIFLAGG
jgi:pimeloyl-ACP methyl ester carboxylesterase